MLRKTYTILIVFNAGSEVYLLARLTSQAAIKELSFHKN